MKAISKLLSGVGRSSGCCGSVTWVLDFLCMRETTEGVGGRDPGVDGEGM